MKIREKFNINWRIIILFLWLGFSIASCSHDKYDNETLYNSVGFEPGSAPAFDPRAKYSADYYYRQAQLGGGQMGGSPMINQAGMYQGQMPAQQYQPPYPAQYYPPSYASAPYQVYPNAGSRFYSNPYAIPPSPYYQQYDADQYYVPPTYSYGMEQSGNRGSLTQR